MDFLMIKFKLFFKSISIKYELSEIKINFLFNRTT